MVNRHEHHILGEGVRPKIGFRLFFVSFSRSRFVKNASSHFDWFDRDAFCGVDDSYQGHLRVGVLEVNCILQRALIICKIEIEHFFVALGQNLLENARSH